MPIQSAFTPQATAEAPVARSRAGQTEPREGGEVFVLPETKAAAAGEAKAVTAGKTAVPGDVVAVHEAAAAEQIVVDPTKLLAQGTAPQPAVVPAAPGKPATQAATADASGIALLIAMAAARPSPQAEPAGGVEQAVEPGEMAGAVGQVGERVAKVAKKENKTAAEDKGEATAAAAAPAAENQAAVTPVPVVIPPPVILPAGPLLAVDTVDAVAGDAVEAVPADGGARKDTAKPALAAATAGLPLVTMPVPDAPQAGSVGAAEGKAVPGGVHTVGAPAQGMPELADIVSKADRPAASTGAQPAAEAKAPEALQQQPAAPFDLSTLLQQAPGKTGHERLVQPFDPNAAAGNAPGAPGQSTGTASGQPTPIHVVPIEIGLRAMSGSRQFDIRLDPDELGRVDVNLSISDKGEVSAKLVVDRVETLHLLQRDARTLERAFEQAGLKPSDGGVDITLRDPSDQSAFRQNRQQDEAPQRPRPPAGIELAEDAPLTIDPVPQRRFVRLGGVDLSI